MEEREKSVLLKVEVRSVSAYVFAETCLMNIV